MARPSPLTLHKPDGWVSEHSTGHPVRLENYVAFSCLTAGEALKFGTEALKFDVLSPASCMNLTALFNSCRSSLIWLYVRLPPFKGLKLPVSFASSGCSVSDLPTQKHCVCCDVSAAM